jgi:hypothetical protein
MSSIFEFVHKKRTTVKGEQGTSFDFEHKKRLGTIIHPPQAVSGVAVGGAFSDAFDSNSFWVGLSSSISGTVVSINDFIFKHIKSIR